MFGLSYYNKAIEWRHSYVQDGSSSPTTWRLKANRCQMDRAHKYEKATTGVLEVYNT